MLLHESVVFEETLGELLRKQRLPHRHLCDNALPEHQPGRPCRPFADASLSQ
jgi:hypothetical protein